MAKSKNIKKYESTSHRVCDIIEYLRADFVTAWRGVNSFNKATLKFRGNGFGNYLFSLQAMVMLETALYHCEEAKRESLVRSLFDRDDRYAAPVNFKSGFQIPNSKHTANTLLAMIFDLIRNGHAHEYSTKPCETNDSKHFSFGSFGANRNFGLCQPSLNVRSDQHLVFNNKYNVFQIRPDILFLDILSAIRSVGLHEDVRFIDGVLDRTVDNSLEEILASVDKKRKQMLERRL